MNNGAAFWCVLVAALAIAIAASYKAVARLSPIQPLPLSLPPAPASIGPFAPNQLLRTHLRRIGNGLIPCPEDVAADANGFLFVGCADGWIKRVHPSSDSVENWVHLGAGRRPLGVTIGLHGELIVCDPDMGLLNVTKENVEVLSEEAQGVKFMLTDGVAVSREDGIIYFTDASDKHPLSLFMTGFMEAHPNGRLLKYDQGMRTTTVLMDHLYGANGIALSGNEDFLVFCETLMARCQRYWIKGEKAGHAEIFIDNLPGFPDNIKNDGKGHFWIALPLARPSYMNWLLKYPFLNQLQEVLGVTERMFKMLSKRGLVLAVTEEGVPVLTLADPSGAAIHYVTTAFVVGDDLYLGSLGIDFLGHVKLSAAIGSLSSSSASQ
eukprot:c24167_g1_i2 orf=301-1437(-)